MLQCLLCSAPVPPAELQRRAHLPGYLLFGEGGGHLQVAELQGVAKSWRRWLVGLAGHEGEVSAPQPLLSVTLGAKIPPGWQHPVEGGVGDSREGPALVLRSDWSLLHPCLYPLGEHCAGGEREAGGCAIPWGAGAREPLDGEGMGKCQLIREPWV